MSRTHEVFNQSEALVGHDLFEGNLGLRDGLRLLAPQLDLVPLQALGRQLGQADMQTHARLANSHRPVLHTHSPQGQRIDQVEFHPSYHALMSAAVAAGLDSFNSTLSFGGVQLSPSNPVPGTANDYWHFGDMQVRFAAGGERSARGR